MLAAKQVTAAKTAPGSAGSARCGYVTEKVLFCSVTLRS